MLDKYKKLILTSFFAVFAMGLLVLPVAVYAVSIQVISETELQQAKAAQASVTSNFTSLEGLNTFLLKTYRNLISKVLGQVLNTALTNLASDSAKYIASGGKGQGTMFEQSGFATMLKKVGDATMGQFIESATKALVSDNPSSTIANFSFCNPGNLNVAITIGLGLRNYNGPNSVGSCTFSRIRNNVEKFSNDARLINVFQDMFQPTSNDLGLALTLQGKTVEYQALAKANAEKDRVENKGWLRVDNLIGDENGKFLGFNILGSSKSKNNKDNVKYAELMKAKVGAQKAYDDAKKAFSGTDQYSAEEVEYEALQARNNYLESKGFATEASQYGEVYASDLESAMNIMKDPIFNDLSENEKLDAAREYASNQYGDVPESSKTINDQIWSNLNNRMLSTVGDALVDAANVFLNQLALTTFQNLMKNIGKTGGGQPSSFAYDDNFWKSLVNKDSSPYNPGVKGAVAKVAQLKQAQFSVRADFDILTLLSICPDPNKAGPTDCVIDDKFRQAVQDRKSVGEAMKDGSLPGDRKFGFETVETEPKYNEGYPYRSMLILRKYRILPVGWEVAAEYIHDHFAANEVKGPVTLQYMVNCFSANDTYGEPNGGADWCRGLVDPGWVLKAPKNYCGKLGIGPTIESQNVGANGELTVSRKGDYCADDQSCIKENDDGSCEKYGYCAEDKRVWNFGSSAKNCEPVNNTCRTFSNSETHEQASYLQNTLDFGNCDASVAGCRAYCTAADSSSYAFDPTTQKLAWNCQAGDVSPKTLFLDRDAKTCADTDEGCHQFIRTAEGQGVNLLVNANLEDADKDIRTAPSSLAGGYRSIASTTLTADNNSFLWLKMDPAKVSTATIPVGMQPYGWSYSFSFDSKGCKDTDTFAFDGLDMATVPFASSTDQWLSNQVSANIDQYSPENSVSIKFKILSLTCKIDNLKLERGLQATGFSEYGTRGVIQEKLLPNYLAETNACSLASNADLCKKYVQKCSEDEVGCDMYTSQTENTKVPGRIKDGDACSAECVGFNDYMQTETVFDERGWQFFIPRTAKRCQSQAVGCDEFTNLDKVKAGGESTEYYSYLRQCVKPASKEANGRCTNFYTWQSAGGKDFQLSVVSLYATADLKHPDITSGAGTDCTAEIYNLDPSDPKYQPNCRQYYDKDGNITYRLVEKTISCDDNCHPYRLTRLNAAANFATQASCEAQKNTFNASSTYWDSGKNKCIVCSNNGEMINASVPGAEKYCVYQAIPNQGQRCAASENGCREYVGSRGENVAQVMFNNFEDASLDNWLALGVNTQRTQGMSLRKGGHALEVSAPANFIIGKKVGEFLRPDKTYALSFLAQNNDPAKPIEIYINKSSNPLDASTKIDHITAGTGLSIGPWQLYALNFTASSTYNYTGEEVLVMQGGISMLLDEVKLKEITDRYYFIKESWNTPDSCFKSVDGVLGSVDANNFGLPYQLHCDHYKNRDGESKYLRSFDALCAESAVGCELMIDTQNSKSFATTTSASGVVTPADRYEYVVYDKTKTCAPAQKGCERLGKETIYNNSVSSAGGPVDTSKIRFDDVYLLNDPDSYGKSLCQKRNLNCQSWLTDSAETYFINPLDNVCEYRQKKDSTATAWLKRQMKYCGGVPGAAVPLCTTKDDCKTQPAGKQECVAETSDVACPASSSNTFGPGSAEIYQPSSDGKGYRWAGVCANEQAGCTEYLDPVSKPSPNLLFNANLLDLDDDSIYADGWDTAVNTASLDINLDPFTVYSLGFSAGQSPQAGIKAVMKCGAGPFGSTKVLSGDTNSLVDGPTEVTLKPYENNINFRTNSDLSCRLTLSGTDFTATRLDGEIHLRKTLIDYKLENSLDKTTCNGEVNFGDGCILFNERKIGSLQNGNVVQFASSTFDADLNYGIINDDKKPKIGSSPAENNANAVIKVDADRKCNKWLTCSANISYTDTNGTLKSYCSDLSMCDLLNKDGSCGHVVKVDTAKQTIDNAAYFANFTGYSKVGLTSSPDIQMTGFYAIDRMGQAGDSTKVPNGDFEIMSEHVEGAASGRAETRVYKPSGWEPGDFYSGEVLGKFNSNTWNSAQFSLITDAVLAQKEGVRYPISGKAFLKVGALSPVKSDLIYSGNETTITFWINTKNLSGGHVVAKLYKPDGVTPLGANTTIPAGLDWSMRVMRVPADIESPYVLGFYTLYDGEDAVNKASKQTGRFYLDNIQIKPVLNITEKGGSQYDRAPECRLYPERDSLACEYVEESGLKAKGLSGYCLEYDRAPGNPNACLVWWPGDRISGDGISEEGIGYQGPAPVYYCAQARALVPVVKKIKEVTGNTYSCHQLSNCDVGDGDCSCGVSCPLLSTRDVNGVYHCERPNDCPAGYNMVIRGYDTPTSNNPHHSSYAVCEADTQILWQDKTDPTLGWYQYMGNFQDRSNTLGVVAWYGGDVKVINGVATRDGGVPEVSNMTFPANEIKFWDPNSGTSSPRLYDDRMAYCDTVVRTVTEGGDNKFWSGRVFANSKYKLSGLQNGNLNYTYPTTLYPFSSIVTPQAYDPFNWDGDMTPGTGADPIIMTAFDVKTDRIKQPNMMPYNLVDNGIYHVNRFIGYCAEGAAGESGSFDACLISSGTGTLPSKFICAGSEKCFKFPNQNQATDESLLILKNIYAQSYGVWFWDYNQANTGTFGHYVSTSTGNWVAPKVDCDGTEPSYHWNCGNPPTIFDVSVNGKCTNKDVNETGIRNWGCSGDLVLHKSGFATLYFNTSVDLEQRPLKNIEIIWGNGKKDSTVGAQISDRSDPTNPHVAQRLFDYWALKSLSKKYDVPNELQYIGCNDSEAKCGGRPGCSIRPKVRIMDNWGFCTDGTACDNGEAVGSANWITVCRD